MSHTVEGVSNACSLVSNKNDQIRHSAGYDKETTIEEQSRRRSDPIIVPTPNPPQSKDYEGWQRFLAAYRSGRWDLSKDANDTESDDDLISSDLSIVHDINGICFNNKDYFDQYKYLAPPNLPPKKRRKRHEALLRHGIVYPHVRQHLQRYVELAKRIFDCDMVTLSFASADEKNIIFLAADGPPLSSVPNCASICSHALLLEGDSDIFVVPDMAQDWRFDRLFGKDNFHPDLSYRFHASAPIFLSCSETPCCKVSVSPVHAGRFSIFSAKPRPNFQHSDARTLLDFARMTQEAMENDMMEKFVSNARLLQRESAKIIVTLNESFEARIRSEATMQAVGSALHGMGDLFPQLNNNSAISNGKSIYNSLLEDVDAMQRMLDVVRPCLSASAACLIDGSRLSFTPASKPNNLVYSHGLIDLITASGDITLLPDSQSIQSISLLHKWFEMVRSQPAGNRSQILQRSEFSQGAPIRVASLNQKSGLEKHHRCPYSVHGKGEMPCCCVRYTAEGAEMIEPILPAQVATCLVIPIVAENTTKLEQAPLAMMCILWDQSTSISISEMDFCNTLAVHLAGLACQEQGSVINHGQLNLIRMMQHELRTPLNGIMGISEALCDDGDNLKNIAEEKAKWSTEIAPQYNNPFVGANTITEGKDRVTLAAEILAPQLESIHVSSIMLKNILDDILSLDSMFEGANESGREKVQKNNRNSYLHIDLGKSIENACREELRYFELEAMRTFRALITVASLSPSEKSITPGLERRRSSLAAIAAVVDSIKGNMEEKKVGNQGSETSHEGLNETFLTKLESLESSFTQGNKVVLSLPPCMTIKIDPNMSLKPLGDHNKVLKIIRKLVSNAIKFTPQEGIVEVEVNHVSYKDVYQHVNTVQIQAENERQQGKDITSISSLPEEDTQSSQKSLQNTYWIFFRIKDTGIGMKSEFLQNNYLKPFIKADNFSQGTGLGSTVAFALIKSINGAFTIQSHFNEGTEINIFLPFFCKDDIGIANEPFSNSLGQSMFKFARFIGFQEEVGSQNVRKTLEQILKKHKIEILQERHTTATMTNDSNLQDQEVVYIFHENAFSAPKSSLPSKLGQKGIHSIIFSRNSLKSQSDSFNLSLVKEGPYAILSPPFSPSTWTTFERLLYVVPKVDLRNESNQSDLYNEPDHLDVAKRGSLFDPEDVLLSQKTDKLTKIVEQAISNSVEETVGPLDKAPERIQSVTIQTSFKVLAVEDNPINMRLLTGVLRKLGITYVEARDGEEAVKQFKSFEPTVVLLDISLPLMDGFDACIAMRKYSLPFRSKIVAITAFSTPEDKERGLNFCGMDDWYTKPVSISMLKALLSQWRTEHEESTK